MIDEEIDFTDANMLRAKAEKQLRVNAEKSDASLIEIDVKKLVHELQVHQIELEMQNVELKQAYETSETALKKYTMLYDLAPMGYFTLASDGTIYDLNFTAAELLREKRFSLLNSNFKLFISEDSKPLFNDFFRKVFTSYTKKSCQLMLGYDNNFLCEVFMEGIFIGDAQRCLLSIFDISDFKKE